MELATKEKILLSSIDLFSEKGFSETSVRQIAKETGIKASSIYNYFNSKEEILNYIFKMYYKKMYDTVATREEIDKMLATEDTATILNSVLFSLEEEEQELYMKILKIILQEQYRNEQAAYFVKQVLYMEVEDYLRYALEKLCENHRIKKIDCTLYAKMINAINVASIVEFAHFTPKGYSEKNKNKNRLDITNHILDTIKSV